MQVKLINYTSDPELTVATAARSTASDLSPTDLVKRLTPGQVNSLIKRLISSGHLSPFEHVSFTFSIEGISRVTSHQLVRHRLASYSQRSQRYVSLKELNYITPPSVSTHRELQTKYRKLFEEAHRLYWEMIQHGIPAEDARYIIPQGVETTLVMTMNARELMHVCSLRLCLRAQWEIVQLFQTIKEEVSKVAPLLGEELQPKCFRLGYCDEDESCGLFPVREPVEIKERGKDASEDY